ncbi:MAG: fibronectin type III domain-containing protein, partial [Cyclobacteriaceae bacterium]
PLQINSNTTELQIGAKYGNNRWEGDLDEVRLYHGALNDQEIIDLYNGTSEVPQEPTAPLLTSPENFATDVSRLNLSLNWEAPASADEYRIQVSEYPDFSGALIEQTNITVTSFTLPDLVANTTYFWRVIASNEEGYSPWSQVWRFTTLDDQTPIEIPGTPVPISPSDGENDLPITVELNWETESLADNYNIQVSTISDFSSFVVDIQENLETSFTTPQLQANTTYFWRVAASNSEGDSPWSQVRSFTTLDDQTPIEIPGTPVPISPSDGENDLPITVELNWETESLADNYNIQVSTISDFSSFVVDIQENLETSFTTPQLQANTTYFWRVAASNSEGDSPWSPTRTFTTAEDPSGSLEELVGHWKMEEGSGSTLIDHSGKGNDATIENNSGVTWVTGVEGLALSLTGSFNRYASVPHNASLDINEAITIAAWIKPDGLLRKRILSKS